MPSVFSHAVASLGISACFYRRGVPKRVWIVGALGSVIPDLDVAGFRFGVHYGDFWGHRGFTHSLTFAAFLAGATLISVFPHSVPNLSRVALWVYLFLATASHGLLDAMTDGGLGVAFFAPFNNARYFFPWTPIHVSPIGISRFFSARGLAVVRSELLWVWVPAAVLTIAVWLSRQSFRTRAPSPPGDPAGSEP
jgi:inner membrane protein